MLIKKSVIVGDKELSIETGRLAKQADGSVVVRYGDTMLLATAVSAREKKDVDFLPLTVEYKENLYAAGKIPGSFFKREGKLSEKETLSSRLIDRSCRPLFPRRLRLRDPGHHELHLVGRSERPRRARADGLLGRAVDQRHSVQRPDRRRSRRSHRRQAHREPHAQAA
jgi:hypothetical protein